MTGASGPAGLHGGTAEVSPWVSRWGEGVARGAFVLDLACGSGRHSRWFAGRGCRVLAIDRDESLAPVFENSAGIEFRAADLESGPWPLADSAFDAVVVTNYLHRPRFPEILAAVRPGGTLLYETFAAGNERFGRPANPAFLLRPGELLERVRGEFRVIAFEDIETGPPRPAMVQRVCAVRHLVSIAA